MTLPWTPTPAAREDAALPPALVPLVERLARHAHDVWAAARLAEGWRWGPQRDDARREHPCLVPFEALPSEEQEYDRRHVRSTLHAVLREGWTLRPPGDLAVLPHALTSAEQWLAQIPTAGFDTLFDITRKLSDESEATTPEVCIRLAKRFLSLGHLLLAEQLAERGIARATATSSVALRLRHVFALAAVRCGAPLLASERIRNIDATTLRELAAGAEYSLYVELRSLQGRIDKELAQRATDASTRRDHWRRAFAHYAEAAAVADQGERDGADGFPHINAAAIAAWLGDALSFESYVTQAVDRAQAAHVRNGTDPWPVATLGEAAFMRGDRATAEAHYRLAARLAGDRAGDVASMRRQARLHALHLGVSAAETIDAWLAVPPVVVFTGHLPDAADRRKPRLPLANMPAVSEALDAFLRERGVAHGFSSAAAGSDLLFLELLEARGVPAQVVLPYRREAFLHTSVLMSPGDWEPRFMRQLERAARRHLLCEISGTPASANDVAFEFGNLVLLGLARQKARELETDVLGVALWDGEPGSPGGTAHTVSMWRTVSDAWAADAASQPRLRIETISPPRVRPVARTRAATVGAETAAGRGLATSRPHRIAGVLFADVVGFSQLDEEAVPRFFDRFLGEVGRRLAMHPVAPLVRNTWGDGLFLVFPRVEDAGRFALELCAALQTVDWTTEGLPADLAVRVGVHAGPLFEFVDRVTGQLTLSGRHVTQAARIEPVTPPGVVYASTEFAALAAAYGVTSFRCESVGQVPLAKGFASTGLYIVQPTNDAVEAR